MAVPWTYVSAEAVVIPTAILAQTLVPVSIAPRRKTDRVLGSSSDLLALATGCTVLFSGALSIKAGDIERIVGGCIWRGRRYVTP